MSQIIPIYIPTYISDANFAPGRVLPRLFYYNGLIDCEEWYFESGSLTTSGVSKTQTQFPYFDNYNVVTGSFPTAGSKSLLFNNEAAVYGEMPSASLFTDYWDTYVGLLYNPKTRLLTCKAIIPLADYVKMELNDIVNFRGAYYHLRAINEYSLKTGDCELQLLGPIISDTFSRLQPAPTPPVTGGYAEISWSFTESNADASFRIYNNGSNIGTLTSNGSGNARVSASNTINAEMDPVGSWPASDATMSIFINGGVTQSTSSSANTTIFTSFTAQSGSVYYITGSAVNNGTASICCTPTITTASINGGNIDISFTTGSGCASCTYTTIQTSTDGVTWGGNNTGGCTSPRSITAPTVSTYYRILIGCGAVTSSYSNAYYLPVSTGIYSYSNCGYGDTVGNACTDALINARTLYSDCDSLSFGGGCVVYADNIGPSPLTGNGYVFINGAVYDINPANGVITGVSSIQC